MYALSLAASVLTAASVAYAQQPSATPTPIQWNVTIGGNTTANATLVFQPAEIHASIGDTVYFNFTQGNHSLQQSTFAAPCQWIDITNPSVNGFTSGFRDAGNGTSITNYILPITSNDTIWFFDYNTCALGGVGGININDSSTATLAGFVRNAKRLNGTATSTSASSSATRTSASGGSGSGSASPSSSSTASGAERNVVLGGLTVIPLILAAFAL